MQTDLSLIRPLITIASACGLILGPAACDRASAPTPTPRNLIIISVDTLRADHLGTYGYDRPTSPGMDQLAKFGTLVLDVTAQCAWTSPSMVSMMLTVFGLQLYSDRAPVRVGSRHPVTYPVDSFSTRDGDIVMVCFSV